jgi:hypothetical protein
MSDLKVRFSVNGEEAEYSRIDEKIFTIPLRKQILL